MTKSFIFLLFAVAGINTSYAQETTLSTIPVTMPYGKVDMADMTMTGCEFEKDANAEVLFDKGDVYYQPKEQKVYINRHKRIKIFNDNGKKEADIRLEFVSAFQLQHIEGLDAETINLVDGKQEITKVDSKLIYVEKVDKYRVAYVFSFPNVQPGSVIEFKYLWSSSYGTPPWNFQSTIPTRYSILTTDLPATLTLQIRGGASAITNESTKGVSNIAYAGFTGYNDVAKRSMTNVRSFKDEPYMTSAVDNLHSVYFRFNDPNHLGLDGNTYLWNKVCEDLYNDDDFGGQLNRKLAGEEAILAKAKQIRSVEERTAFIFKEVRNAMKWNGIDDWYTIDGTVKAWDKKSGNSTEINLILYHLLNKASINADPTLVSTRSNGKVFGAYPTVNQFNRTVVSVAAIDATLDATGKYNLYNEVPEELLNNFALITDRDRKIASLSLLERKDPTRQIIMVTADIKADGKLAGTAEITNVAYSRINNIKKYKTEGEQKYIDYLRNNDNTLRISALKMDNMEVDSLPLVQNVTFNMDLTGSDGTYIYLTPAIFYPQHNNPFLNTDRVSDIDFGYRDNFSMVGSYKIPDGYKTDVLPKNTVVQTPDQSITFRRTIGEQDGTIVVRYVLDHKKSTHSKDEYTELFDLYKKLHELTREPVVLKKA